MSLLEQRNENRLISALERENTRLRRSVRELSLLNDMALAIGAANEMEEIIRVIVKRSIKAVEARQGDIMLVNKEKETPMQTLVRTSTSSSEQPTFKLDSSLLGWMMFHKKPLIINDPSNNEHFRSQNWDPAIKNVLCVPLLIRSRLIGMLSVYNNRREPPAFTPDDQRLLSIIAAQSAQIIDNARLMKEEKELLGMQEELRLATDIQAQLLPQQAPNLSGYDVAGCTLPAKDVGGDYFDYIQVSETKLATCVGDVSGKGLPASLLMASVQATVQGQALLDDPPALALARINQLVCRRTRKGSFVTLFYGVLDAASHTFRFANAGHNRPLLFRANGDIERLDLGSIMLGFQADHEYEEGSFEFDEGDVLVIFSDGIVEARSDAGIDFEDDKLIRVVSNVIDKPAAAIQAGVLEAVQSHVGDAPQGDDITLLVIKRA